MSTNCWAPSKATILTLKQFGIPEEQIEAILELYTHETDHPSDDGLIQTALRMFGKPKIFTRQSVISYKPSPSAVSKLESHYHRSLINYAIVEFQNFLYQERVVPINIDRMFNSYLGKRYPVHEADNEQPSIAAEKTLSVNGINDKNAKKMFVDLRGSGRSEAEALQTILILYHSTA